MTSFELPVIETRRHRIAIDGIGVITLIAS